mgnify:CR=1 FL=1
MKIVLAQQNYHIGNFEANTRKIIEAVEAAKVQGADLILFSELSVCGYPPRDFLEFHDFIQKCTNAVQEIQEHADSIAVIIGAPVKNERKEGKDLHNAAFFLYEKEQKAFIHNTSLPNYHLIPANR